MKLSLLFSRMLFWENATPQRAMALADADDAEIGKLEEQQQLHHHCHQNDERDGHSIDLIHFLI